MYASKETIVGARSPKDLFRSYSNLVRPTVVMMGVTNGLVGIFYAGLSFNSLAYGLLAILTISSIAAFSYGYNQLTDLDEDRINSPHRPLVTGELSINECKVFLSVLLFFSIVPLLIFGRYLAFFLMLLGPVFSGVTYSRWRVKSLIIKPFFVAYGWSFVPLIAYATVTNSLSPVFLIFLPFFLLLMFLTTTMGDLRDVKGDKENNVKTLPVIFGEKSVIKNIQLYAILNYSLLAVGVILKILPLDVLFGAYGGLLLLRYMRTQDVLSRQKGMKKSLARFSWITSLGIVLGRIIAILIGFVF